jgi:hypothetical protein
MREYSTVLNALQCITYNIMKNIVKKFLAAYAKRNYFSVPLKETAKVRRPGRLFQAKRCATAGDNRKIDQNRETS